VVEWGGLENRCGGNSIQGSNPCLSAIIVFKIMILQEIMCLLTDIEKSK
jgi:hypothetical protein